MMSKAELARKAGVTVQTIDRIERGYECRVATKRKIILALGYQLSERSKIFVEGEKPGDKDDIEKPAENVSQESRSPFMPQEGERVRVLRKKKPVSQ